MDCTGAGRHAFWQIKLFTARPRESKRSSMMARSVRFTFLAAMLLVGCHSSQDKIATESHIHPRDLPGRWTVTAVDVDRGHLTYEGSNSDHTYVLGIECERASDSTTLLYYDRLPVGLDITVGDQLDIDTTSDSDFESMFGGGYWIRDLVLTRQ